jgi:hypothetical protein
MPVPNVMKIDVEEHEEQVLKGSIRILSEHPATGSLDYKQGDTVRMVSELLMPWSSRHWSSARIGLPGCATGKNIEGSL